MRKILLAEQRLNTMMDRKSYFINVGLKYGRENMQKLYPIRSMGIWPENMRTKTLSIESDGKQTSFPIPKDWNKIITITVDGESVEYEATIDKDKRTLRLKRPIEDKKIIKAHVILKD